jgi:hypothetical protein
MRFNIPPPNLKDHRASPESVAKFVREISPKHYNNDDLMELTYKVYDVIRTFSNKKSGSNVEADPDQ